MHVVSQMKRREHVYKKIKTTNSIKRQRKRVEDEEESRNLRTRRHRNWRKSYHIFKRRGGMETRNFKIIRNNKNTYYLNS